MEKIELKLASKNDSFDYGEKVIEIKTLIDTKTATALSSSYMLSALSDDKSGKANVFLGEFSFRIGIILQQTNISITKIEDPSELDLYLWGKLYEEIKSRILNYELVHSSAEKSLELEIEKQKMEFSTGKVLDEVITYISGFVNQFKNIDPKEMDKFKEEALSIMEQMKASPVSEILSETKKSPRKRTKKSKEYVQ